MFIKALESHYLLAPPLPHSIMTNVSASTGMPFLIDSNQPDTSINGGSDKVSKLVQMYLLFMFYMYF